MEDDLKNKRQSQESTMKKRLEERRKKALESVSADTAEAAAEELRLVQEAATELAAQRAQLDAEEAAERERTYLEHQASEAAAAADLQAKEAEAAMIAAKAAVIKTFNASTSQAKKEADAKAEVEARKAKQAAAEAEHDAEKNKKGSTAKDKLLERRKAKEAELKTKKESALAALEDKQKADAETRERLREAKAAWTTKISDIIKVSKALGLGENEREDKCYNEALDLVPVEQLMEAVTFIQHERHSKKRTALLKAHFDERVKKIKDATEKTVHDKTNAKVALLSRLGDEGASEEEIERQLTELNNAYALRLNEDESSINAELEPAHMQAMIDLRQELLEDISRACELYGDEETRKKLSEDGASQEEELRAYQVKLEKEQKESEEALKKQKAEAEQALRIKMAKDLDEMKAMLEKEQSIADREIERKKKDLLKQKEEYNQKKAEEAMGDIVDIEKDRIRMEFEMKNSEALAELDELKTKNKSNLKERLNRRRKDPAVAAAEAAAKLAQQAPAATDATAASPPTSPRPAEIPAGHVMVGGYDPSENLAKMDEKLDKLERLVLAFEKRMREDEMNNKTKHSSAHASSPIGTDPDAATSGYTLGASGEYLDRFEPTPGTALESMEDADIALTEKARIEYGVHLATKVSPTFKMLRIRIAKTLPPAPSHVTGNAFINSYRYNEEQNCLYVHHKRLDRKSVV